MTELFRDLHEAGEPRALTRGLWGRRTMMVVLTAVAVLALVGVFGQRTVHSAAAGPAATMVLDAPRVLRGGLLFQSRVRITATRTVEHPRLVLDRGWLEGMQISSITPDPDGQSSRGDGRTVLTWSDPLAAGSHTTIWMQFQVDPTSVGHRPYGLELDDAQQRLARIDRSLTVLP
jgi:hypothetical protein